MIGFGLSEKPTREQAHTLDGHIAKLIALIRHLGLERITVVCHDWGGPTGLSFAMSSPERVRALNRHEHLGLAAAARGVSYAFRGE
jgi:pimeloyl-ACP methyl ester carboxylesterase